MLDDLPYRTLAAVQHGVISRSQLRELALDRHAVRRRVANGSLQPVSERCLIIEGSPDTVERRCWTAILDADGVLSHRSALGLWELPGFDIEPIEVTRRRGGRVRSTHVTTIHAPRLLMPHHLTSFRDIPVTTPARTLFDAAAVLHPSRLERALDTAWAWGLVDARTLRRTAFELSRQGRTGLTAMRKLLQDREDHYRPPESGLEARFQSVMSNAGITGFERQVDVGGEDTWLGRSDFRHVERAVVVFVDSARHHSALIDQRRDQAQRADLERAGWTVVRVTDVEVWHRPRDVTDRVAAALASASARRSVT